MTHDGARRLADSLGQLAYGDAEAKERRDAALEPLAAGQFNQQIQLPVTGRVGRTPVSIEIPVTWPHPFLTRVAGSRGGNGLTRPHFTSGVEMVSDAHTIVSVQVRQWRENDSGFIVGALMRIVAWTPDANRIQNFRCIVHLNFSGYAGPSEDDSEG